MRRFTWRNQKVICFLVMNKTFKNKIGDTQLRGRLLNLIKTRIQRVCHHQKGGDCEEYILYLILMNTKVIKEEKGSKVSCTSMMKLIKKVEHRNSSEDLREVNITKCLYIKLCEN